MKSNVTCCSRHWNCYNYPSYNITDITLGFKTQNECNFNCYVLKPEIKVSLTHTVMYYTFMWKATVEKSEEKEITLC